MHVMLRSLQRCSGIVGLLPPFRSFLHLNYSSGIQDKRYKLKTIFHKRNYILAKSLDHGHAQPRILYIHDITKEWVNKIYGKNYRFSDRTPQEQIYDEILF